MASQLSHLDLVRVSRLFVLVIAIVFAERAFSNTTVKMCVPEQSNVPFYDIQPNRVGGLTIERMQYLFAQNNLQHLSLEIAPRPWQRCIKSIEQGDMDLIVAGYSEQRAEIGVFPDQVGFTLTESYFSDAKLCLVKMDKANWQWENDQLIGLDQLTLGIEPGYLIPENHPIHPDIQYVPIWDVSQKHQFVLLERVNAVLTVCGVLENRLIPEAKNIPPQLVVSHPPFFSSPVYLMFSQSFQSRNPKDVRTILSALEKLNKIH